MTACQLSQQNSNQIIMKIMYIRGIIGTIQESNSERASAVKLEQLG
jgi:hypothetical protein